MAPQQPSNGSARRSVKDLLKEQVQLLNEQTAEVEAELQPLHDEVNQIQVEIDALKNKQREIALRAKGIAQERLVPLRQELSAAARASGGLALSDNPSTR